MDILMLGGTAFLGRAIVRAAIGAGHAVTCAARGTAPHPEGAALIVLDRDQDDALRVVSDSSWDAVIDVSRQPGHVRRAVRDLQTRHWVFVSSSNAYAHFDRLEQSEDAPLLDPLEADVMEDMSTYGEAKVACENAVRSSEGTATIVRSGLIAGWGDESGRSGYYPWRFAHPTGSDVLVPGDLDFPIALIDVRDLAAWIVLAAAEGLDGTFNATGPTLTLQRVLAAAASVAAGDAVARPVPVEVLKKHGVAHWMGPRSLPLWVDDPDWRFFATMDTSAATRAGLRIRPIEETFADVLRYENQRTEPRMAGLDDDEERLLRGSLDGD